MTLFFVLGISVVLVVGVTRFVQRRRRARELEDWAGREGWTYAESDPSVRGFGCSPAEHGATERHVLRGTARDGRFGLLTDHPGAAAATVGPAVVTWLVTEPRMRGTSFRLDGDTLVLWHRGSLTPPLLELLLDLAAELRSRLGQEGVRTSA